MQQRVVIAMALANDPALLILDEPTTGLDATVEAEVLDLVASCRPRLGTSVLFISHNLGVISKMCDRVGVLYAGRLVEEGPVRDGARTIRATPTRSACCAASRARGVRKDRRPPRHDPRLPAAARRGTCRAASSPTAARSPTTAARPRSRPTVAARRPRTRRAAATTSGRTSCRARRRATSTSPVVDREAPSRCSQLDDLGKVVPPARRTTSTRSSA